MATASLHAAQILTQHFLERHPNESAAVLTNLPPQETLRLLKAESLPQAVEVFIRLNLDVAVQVIEHMDEETFIQFFSLINPVRGAALLARLNTEDIEKWLKLLPATIASELKELMTYPPDAAGSIMDPRVTAFHSNETVEQALTRIRTFRDRRIIDICVIDADGFLTGVISLQETAISLPNQKLSEIAQSTYVSVHALTPRDEVVDLLETHKLSSIPVTDINGRLLGIIRNDALMTAVQQDAIESIQAMVGASREERALSKATFAIKKRLPWLQINLGTAFLAAAVVGLFQDTIARFTALAILLPVVAGQSGNTGAQALAVTMRGLALREVRVRDWLRVVKKEVFVGFVNGCGIGLTTAFFVYIFMGQGLALVIGVSMVLSMISASLAGAIIPIILTALRQDPAASASIILTTVTDVMGFLSFLGFATILANVFHVAL